MHRVAVSLVVIALVLAALPASAGKIGFVNAEQAVASVDEGKVKFAELRAWQEPRTAVLDQLLEEIQALRQQLSSAQGTASPEEVRNLETQTLAAQREFEDKRREYERELEKKKNEFLSDVASKIGQLATEYAKANDYDAVFLLTAQPMVYVSESANLTDTVVELYNERFPVN